jgi:hypothetical protein
MPLSTPMTLISTVRMCSSIGVWLNGPMRMIPAQLNSASMRPPLQRPKAATCSRKAAGSRTSNLPVKPRASPISPPSRPSPASSTSNRPVLQPRSANSRAVSRPIPEAAPVMKIAFSLVLTLCSLLLRMDRNQSIAGVYTPRCGRAIGE